MFDTHALRVCVMLSVCLTVQFAVWVHALDPVDAVVIPDKVISVYDLQDSSSVPVEIEEVAQPTVDVEDDYFSLLLPEDQDLAIETTIPEEVVVQAPREEVVPPVVNNLFPTEPVVNKGAEENLEEIVEENVDTAGDEETQIAAPEIGVVDSIQVEKSEALVEGWEDGEDSENGANHAWEKKLVPLSLPAEPEVKRPEPLVLEPVEFEEEAVDEVVNEENDEEYMIGTWDVLTWDIEDEIDDQEEKYVPLEIVYSPTTITYTSEGLPHLTSVKWVSVTGAMPYCSMMSRLNLEQFYPTKRQIAGIWSSKHIARGDAIALIDYGIAYGDLTRVAPSYMQEVLDESGVIAHDVYLYKPSDAVSNAEISNDQSALDALYVPYILQWHRVVAFKADDENRYVLDTLRGTKSTTPQPLDQYLSHPNNIWHERYLHTDLVIESIKERGGLKEDDILLQDNTETQDASVVFVDDGRIMSEANPFCTHTWKVWYTISIWDQEVAYMQSDDSMTMWGFADYSVIE